MKLKLADEIQSQLIDIVLLLRAQWRQQPVLLWIFLALCFNLVLAPTVLAATGGEVSRLNAYAIGLLGLVTVGLSVYLMVVMLQPQRF